MIRPATVVCLAFAATSCGASRPSEPSPVVSASPPVSESAAQVEPEPAPDEQTRLRPETSDRELIERVGEIRERVDELNEQVEDLAKPTPPSEPTRRRGPIPGVVYSVPDDGDPAWGPADAKVTIVVVSEFTCPHCERIRPVLEEIEQQYAGQSVRILFKSFIVHPTRATLPAQAACAAHMQARYFDLAPLLWDAYLARKFDSKNDTQELIDIAATVSGMDIERFEADMLGSCVSIVQNDQQVMKRLEVGGVPTMYVNGLVLTDRTLDGATALVAEEMDKADERIADGTPQADYYQVWVVDRGAKSND